MQLLFHLEMNLDLLAFFNDDGLNNLINLALSLGGKDGSTTKIKNCCRTCFRHFTWKVEVIQIQLLLLINHLIKEKLNERKVCHWC